MKQRRVVVVMFCQSLLLIGCGQGSTAPENESEPVSLPTADADNVSQKPEAQHEAKFAHAWPQGEGGSGGLSKPRPDDTTRAYYGFDGEEFRSTSTNAGKSKAATFTMELLDHRDGIDIYRVTRRITVGEESESGGTQSVVSTTSVTVEYSGEPVTAFDDEYGVAKFVPIDSP